MLAAGPRVWHGDKGAKSVLLKYLALAEKGRDLIQADDPQKAFAQVTKGFLVKIDFEPNRTRNSENEEEERDDLVEDLAQMQVSALSKP